MADELTQAELEELKRLEKAATPGEWDTGPNTLAGEVWLYTKGSPVAEPAGSFKTLCPAWIRHRIGLYRLRRDAAGDQRWWAGESLDASRNRWWRQQQANAAFIAAARNAMPKLLAMLADRDRRIAELEKP